MYRWVLDTNVIISGLFWAGSESKLLTLAQEEKFKPVLCGFVIEETHRIIREKFSELTDTAESTFEMLLAVSEYYPMLTTGEIMRFKENFGDVIQDPHDLEILVVVKNSGVDALVSGDKHFHTAEVQEVICVLTAGEALLQIAADADNGHGGDSKR